MITRLFRKIIFVIIASMIVISPYLNYTSGEVVLTNDFIVNALKFQESASTPGLFAKYRSTVYHNDKEEGVTKREVQYVRTSDALFMEVTQYRGNTWENVEKVLVSRYRYESGLDNWQCLTINNKTGEKSGVIGKGINPIFTTQNMMETVMYPLRWGKRLIDIVKDAKISGIRKDIDGHNCWLLEGNVGPQGIEQCRMWIDSDIGFCPRLIEFESPSRPGWLTTVSFQDYQEIAQGVWFPGLLRTSSNIDKEGNVANEKHEVVCKVIEMYAAKPIPDITVEFPSGTTVYDEKLDTYYSIP